MKPVGAGETAMRGLRALACHMYSRMLRLADQDGLAASLLDRFLGGLGELVRVDGDGGLDLAVVEHLDQAVLLAQQAEGDDLVEGELGDRSRRRRSRRRGRGRGPVYSTRKMLVKPRLGRRR